MKFKKFLASFLAIMCAFASLPVYASENNTIIESSSITEDTTIHAPEISELAETLKNGSMISNIIISENTVTYTIDGNIEASITKRDEKGISVYTIIENGKTDEIIISPSTNKAYMNGSELGATVTTTYVPSDAHPMAYPFIYYGTQTYNVSLTARIRFATLSAIIVAMQALIAPSSINLPTVAALCIQFAEASQSNSDDIIVLRATSIHKDYIAYQYYDTYKIDGSVVTTDTFEHWE